MGSNPADGNEPDWEAKFYDLLARNKDDVDAIVQTVRKDLFDASQGQQVGLTADGNVGLLMVLNQQSAKMLVDAWESVIDHACEAGIDTIMHFFYYQGLLLKDLVPLLDPEVQATEFFKHGEETTDD